MSTIKAYTHTVGLIKVQHCIVPATAIGDPSGVVVKESYVDSSVLTLSVIMTVPGPFDECKKEALLKAVMDKLAEIEL